MPNWNDILNEIKETGSTYDVIRRRYLRDLSNTTRRNVIIYYSGWLQKEDLVRQGIVGFSVDDFDKNGFMTTIHKLNRKKGLDLLLHTPGGSAGATESLVEYLRSMFGDNLRVIIPQMAMSAGTMIALSASEIFMGEQSSLGPIDPQVNGIPAHGVLEEFLQAAKDIKDDPGKIHVWQPIIAKYRPTFIGECEKAIEWSKEMAEEWLVTGMFRKYKNKKAAKSKAKRIVDELTNLSKMKSHDRHISISRAKKLGLRVKALEKNQKFQDAVLSVHHACIHTLAATEAIKIIENHEGTALIRKVKVSVVRQ